jgi:transketolase
MQGLGRPTAIVGLEPFAAKWDSFGWDVVEIDGHDVAQISAAFDAPRSGRPRCIIASTIKGRGVEFMEDDVHWHYQVLNEESWSAARAAVLGRVDD